MHTHLVEVVRGELSVLNDNVVQYLFLIRLLENVGFNSVLRNKPVNMHISGLSDTMTSVLALLVHGRVPVRVVKDDRVCSRQVDTQTSRPSRENEHGNLGIRVEPLRQQLSLLDLGGTV